jgi:transcriptional regulator with XRE-family HTH domain
MHEPSVRVLKSIGEALNVSAETLFEQAGLTSPAENLDDEATESTIRADQRLSEEQRRALLGVYRSYVGANTEIRF